MDSQDASAKIRAMDRERFGKLSKLLEGGMPMERAITEVCGGPELIRMRAEQRREVESAYRLIRFGECGLPFFPYREDFS